MKTAVSLPDELFTEADKYASEKGLSRSALYAAALEEYISRHKYEGLTEAINNAVRECDGSKDYLIRHVGKKQLRNLEW